MNHFKMTLWAAAAALMILTGCTTTQGGALLGSGIGAGAGALIGNQYGHAAQGALIGAAFGGLGGALIGDAMGEYSAPQAPCYGPASPTHYTTNYYTSPGPAHWQPAGTPGHGHPSSPGGSGYPPAPGHGHPSSPSSHITPGLQPQPGPWGR